MTLTEPSTAPARDALAGLIPVSIVTGFLGSGKTTLINRLLKRPEMNRVAVIVNELGEIGIDNELVEVSS
ncbi:MAG: GTP-binding protein, partial [Betaproteobacteria bacterium]|nr:GTP-binding protein [Betaproteobacteria bacterium]